MIKFDQAINEKDYSYFVDFNIFERKPFNKLLLLYLAPVLGIGLLVLFYIGGDETNALFVVLCGFLILLGWSMKFVFKIMSKTTFRRNPIIGAKNRITFTEDEVIMTSKQGTSRNKYISVVKVYVTKNYIIAFFNNQQFLGIKTYDLDKELRGEIIKTYKSKCLGRLVFKS